MVASGAQATNDDAVNRAETYPYASPAGSFVVDLDAGACSPLSRSQLAGLVNDRRPMLAIGSNAAPEQLVRKLRDATPDSTVPVMEIELPGYDVVFAARVSPYGAIPATLVESPGTKVCVKVTWLTDDQARVMDDSESIGTGYVRADVSVEAAKIEGEPVAQIFPRLTAIPAYVAVAGPLQEEGSSVPLAEIGAEGRRWPAKYEPEILRRVAGRFGRTTANLVHTVLDDHGEWERLNEELRRFSGHGSVPLPPPITCVYGTRAADHRRRGVPYVVTVSSHMGRLVRGATGLAVLQRYVPGAPMPLRVVAHVEIDPVLEVHEVRMDQSLRTAVGLPALLQDSCREMGGLSLHMLRMSVFARAANLISGRLGRQFLMLRVAQPNPNDIEKRLCRVATDDLLALGAEPGSRLVFFGASSQLDGSFRLVRQSLQALPLTADGEHDRRDKEEADRDAGWAARYRDAPHLLDVGGRDLSNAFLDRDARDALQVDRGFPVLVRRDARSAVFRELQEFGVILLASLLGVSGVLQPLLSRVGIAPTWQGALTLAVAVLVSVVLVVLRLRSDLR